MMVGGRAAFMILKNVCQCNDRHAPGFIFLCQWSIFALDMENIKCIEQWNKLTSTVWLQLYLQGFVNEPWSLLLSPVDSPA
jgi:hypothetical protein